MPPKPPKNLPNTRAVAIRYEQADLAPQVIAKGQGNIADEIIKRAEESGVFIHESRELVSLLMEIDLDARIPPALYTAVAEVLAWVYQQDSKFKEKVTLPTKYNEPNKKNEVPNDTSPDQGE